MNVYRSVSSLNNQWETRLLAAGATIEAGEITHFGDPLREIRAAAVADVVADVSHLALLQVYGAEAEGFLQGQLSNDIRHVTDNHSQLSAYCSPKGRMLAIFRVFKRGDVYLLQLPAALAQTTLKRLSMFILRAKVTLAAADPDLVSIGIAGPSAALHLQELWGPVPAQVDDCRSDAGLTVMRLPGVTPRFQLVGPVSALGPLWDRLKSVATPVGAPVWRWLDIKAGVPSVLPGTVEELVPQMANLDLVGGINFKKGCYPGQEIVARMHYLGRLKQRMVLAHVASDIRPLPGTSVFAPNFPGQSAGMVVDAQAAPLGGHDLLVVAQLSSIAMGDIHLEHPDGPTLTLGALPYSMPIASSTDV